MVSYGFLRFPLVSSGFLCFSTGFPTVSCGFPRERGFCDGGAAEPPGPTAEAGRPEANPFETPGANRFFQGKMRRFGFLFFFFVCLFCFGLLGNRCDLFSGSSG